MSFSRVTWTQTDGSQSTAEVAHGSNLMLAATFEGVPGIDGDCGGCLSCATCHVVVGEAWVTHLQPICAEENSLLDSTAVPRQPNSRLSCQIVAGPSLDGLVLHVPAG